MSLDRAQPPQIVDAVDFELTIPKVESLTINNSVTMY